MAVRSQVGPDNKHSLDVREARIQFTDASGEIGFWILVDPASVSTYVIPEWWIRNDIDEMQAAYAVRATVGAPNATDDDCAPSPVIDRERVERWRDRWDLIEKLLK